MSNESNQFACTCTSHRGHKNSTRMSQFSPSLISCRYFTFIIAVFSTVFHCGVALQQHPSKSTATTPTVQGLPVHRAPLRRRQQQQSQHRQDELYPYCFALSSILDLPTNSNILATQVWPSARVAAKTLEERILANDSNLCALSDGGGETERRGKFTICELGCGPGLPSLTAAAAGASWNSMVDFRVISTDVDEFALDLVNAAAKEQGLDHIVSTRLLDLIQAEGEDWAGENKNTWMKDVDLFVMSDVFESNAVAVGAARFTQRMLSWRDSNLEEKNDRIRESCRNRKRMWVFAQTDRTQRDVYLRELQRLSSPLSGGAEDDNYMLPSSLKWKPSESHKLEDPLWLCDVDETLVDYG